MSNASRDSGIVHESLREISLRNNVEVVTI